MARIGIEDPKGFAKRKYGQRKDVEVLQDCLIGPRYLTQLEAVLDEVEASTSWSDVVVCGPVVGEVVWWYVVRLLVKWCDGMWSSC